MERLKNGVFITPKDIQVITGLGQTQAYKEHQAVRDALGKPGKRITVKEYCDYQGLDYQEIVVYINPFR